MNDKPQKSSPKKAARGRTSEDFRPLSIRILHYANRGVSLVTFFRQLSKIIRDFSGCDAVELRASDDGVYYRARAVRGVEKDYSFEILDSRGYRNRAGEDVDQVFEELCQIVMTGEISIEFPNRTKNGSIWINDTEKPIRLGEFDNAEDKDRAQYLVSDYKSLALMPFILEDSNVGLLILQSRDKFFFTENEIINYEYMAQTLGLAIADRKARAMCSERVKELTCLYGIANVSGTPGLSLEQVLENFIKLIPPALQYPEITAARVILDNKIHSSTNFMETGYILSSKIEINGNNRGSVDIVYLEERPTLYEGPFLREERNLINTIAREIAMVIDRKEAEEVQARLQNQLLHADRLATIGQLAAGVAHELNEPLSGILGFAQLAQKNPELPHDTREDLDKIVRASLHAREIVKKLLIFGRQMPTKKSYFNINKLIREGVYFLESRLAKEQIVLVHDLAEGLPEIYADTAQLHQVLVNLMVNAIQAMPDGGTITIRTMADDKYVIMIVEDTGAGMTDEVKARAFIPFYTTKDIGEGTGLGLSVVHGIVTSHGGTISVDSELGRGTKFIVKIPVDIPDET